MIPARFNGPPASANGGYTCGVLASLLGSDVAQVSLRTPPPVGRPLAVSHHDGRVELHDGATLVAEGEGSELLLDVPEPVHPDDAAGGVRGRAPEVDAPSTPFRPAWCAGPIASPATATASSRDRCRERTALFAADWTPDESLADGDGHVRPECLWGALDCPTSAPVANFGEGPPMVLARLTARIGCDVRVGERHALVSWPLEVDGRKRHAACALFDESGRLLCASRALWIELRETPA